MADARYRYTGGRRSPTLNPARASMPVGIGGSYPYNGDIHAIPTARYDASVPRRGTEPRTTASPNTTITTYNVSKDPVARSSSVREPGQHHPRRRSSVAETTRPIIVTTNHAKPPPTSSHASSTTRASSPPRDSYRLGDEAYYAQPASSIRARSQNRRHGHSHTQSSTALDDEFYRLRERVGGDERLRAPDPYRHARAQNLYPTAPHSANPAIPGYEGEGFEYTGPSDLARYDLEHGRARRSRRESFDRPYYRPSVNIVSNEPARYDARGRGPPPTSVGLDRYNRAAAAATGTYDRPSVTMPSLPSVPPPPSVEPPRRPALIEPAPAHDPRISRPRPVSLYQDAAPRMSHPDDIYRTRDDERSHKDRRDRTEPFRDEDVPTRGFGIRTDHLDSADRRSADPDRRDHDERRPRRELDDRESRRHSDEELDRTRGRESRNMVEDIHPRPRVDDSLDGKESSRSDKVRDKVTSGLGVAAAALGLGGVAKDADADERIASSRRHRDSDVGKEPSSLRPADKYRPRDSSVHGHRLSPSEEAILAEQRRDSRKDRPDSRDGFDLKERERLRDRDRDRLDSDRDRPREKDRDRERDREWDYERDFERERDRKDADARRTATSDRRNESPPSDGDGAASRRRNRNSGVFDPTDTRDLLDIKSQLAAMDDRHQPKEHTSPKERVAEGDTEISSSSERRQARSRAQSRGRESAPTDDKQVRVVSPPREKKPEKPIKGILKQPSAKFPEDNNPIREGVAPHKDDKTKKDVPQGARWTKINRRMVNPEALTIGKERFEVRDEFVIVLRVLSKEEIQAYATATAQIRGKRSPSSSLSTPPRLQIRPSDTDGTTIEMRRKEYEREMGYDRDYDRDDDDRRRRRDRDRDTDSDRERERRRHRELDEESRPPKAIEYTAQSDDRQHSRRRSNRDYD